MENGDSLGVRLRLKVRMLEAKVIEALLYRCVTRIPNKPERTKGYGTFTTPCASDVSAGEDVSATTTPFRTSTRLPRQTH